MATLAIDWLHDDDRGDRRLRAGFADGGPGRTRPPALRLSGLPVLVAPDPWERRSDGAGEPSRHLAGDRPVEARGAGGAAPARQAAPGVDRAREHHRDPDL